MDINELKQRAKQWKETNGTPEDVVLLFFPVTSCKGG